MPFVLPDPEGLAPEVYPLAWLVGTWRGEGVVDYPGIDEATFTQEIVIDQRRRAVPVVHVDDPADRGARRTPAALESTRAARRPVWQTESGYWRIPPERPTDWGLTDGPAPGRAAGRGPVGARRRCTSARSARAASTWSATRSSARASGADVSAGKRLYGLVNGELMWAHDIAAFGHPMQSYASGRLARVEALTDDEA